MIRQRAWYCLFPILLLASNPSTAGVPDAESIAIEQRLGAYELTVPVSKLVVFIPRGNLALGKSPPGAAESPRYFFLEDTAQHLIISGWFEPKPASLDLRKFWEGQTKQWRDNGLPEPQIVSFARFSDWEAVLYDMAIPFGTNSHLRAHWVQAGTWIDLHLSITSERTSAENRAELKRVLKSIRIRQKE